MPLSDAKIRALPPTDKNLKLFDGGGLYLAVSPAGGKTWRLKYRFGGKEQTLTIGRYPQIGLKEAREKAQKAKASLEQGIDPGQMKKAVAAAQTGGGDSFEAIAREWFERNKSKWTPKHGERVLLRLEQNMFPYIGKIHIGILTAPQILLSLRKIEERGAIETAHRVLQECGCVCRYAVATGRAERDATADLKGALAPAISKNMPAIVTPSEFGGLLRSLEGYTGSEVVKAALRLAPLVFVRPGELRQAEWTEFDLAGKIWIIPPEKMKMRREHRVPLASQSMSILEALFPLTGRGRFLFPSMRSAARPMSDNTVNAALRRLGYAQGEMCGHGFRAMASTLLNERGWAPDVIEAQLAHVDGNSVRRAYNRALYWEERVKMMQEWADYLDELRENTGAQDSNR